MAPYTFTPTIETAITLAIGFGFGFVLERAGFGNANNLAAQFYLYDMRVLKVMFTAIVTAMLFTFLAAALGLLDFSRVWVPPTYFWPGVLGGFVLGVGFIIGGYCPGTSLVAVSTFKLDAVAYTLGVLTGIFLFGETVPAYWGFFNHAGAMGRLTIFDLLGVDAGVVVAGVALMAVGAFAFAEWMERLFARPGKAPAAPSPRARFLRRAAVAAALAIAVATLWIGQPSVERKVAWAAPGLDQSLRERKIHIDPAELLGLMRNNQIPLVLIDVRDEADYNLFHLLDAKRLKPGQINARWAAKVPAEAVVVIMSNDERAADEAWRRAAVLLNPSPERPVADRSRVYVLAGGVNRWLDIYQQGNAAAPDAGALPPDGDTFRHAFPLALGSRDPASRPDAKAAPQREFTAKVHVVKPTHHAGGGCG